VNLRFVVQCLVLLLAGGWLTLTAYEAPASGGLRVLVSLLFPLPIAIRWARGWHGQALALFVVALLCAALPRLGAPGGAGSAWWTLAGYGGTALLGVFLGESARRRWPFGVCVAALTVVLFGLGCAGILSRWDFSVEQARVFLGARIAEVQAASRAQADAGSEVSEGTAQVMEGFAWMQRHVAALFVGAFFGASLLLSAGLTWVAQRTIVAGDGGRIAGSFSRMRPPDALVWVCIALAVLWLVEHRWPNETLRVVTWNAALGLSFVYWLNGVGIAVYVMFALKWHALLVALLVGMLMAAQMGSLLSAVGFFDTWYEFRSRVDNLIAARGKRGEEP